METFTYNSLFQLTSVVQPETGTTAYTYGLDGQVATKTDAKGVVTAYGRDGYGRLVGVYVKPVGWTGYDYTQSPTYAYDYGVNAQGRLSTVTLGSVVETYEYSVGGLVTKKKVTFPNNDTPLEANYTYDTEGKLTSMKYPDVYGANGTVAETGRTLSYLYDPLGLAALRDSTYPIAPGTRVSGLRNAAAQITQMVVYKPDGTSDTESFTYNALGQLTQASGRGSNIEYRYSATANDGRITSRKDNVSGEEVSYQYDQLGRLIAASTTGPEWGLAWVYDGFGNRLQQNVTKGTGPSAVFNVDPATNRMTGAGINYDANGNMTGFGTGSGTATYDLFNRMVNVTTGNGTEWYGYSAANQRTQVSRANGTFETFFYGLGGELLGVYQRGTKANGHYYFSSASIRVWFAGRLIDGGGNSMVTDRLGSVVKNGTEALSYYPYGEQRTGNANADREKFATYSRDAVSGLDYAQNRYYSPQFGRFTTADPYRASGGPADPQSWNRYAYVENDPVNFGDPQGLQRRAPICYWQNNIGWEAGWYFTGFQSNICEEWGSEGGGGGRGGPLEWGGGGGASSNTIKKGKLNLYNVTKSGAKSDQAAQAFKNLKDNLAKDSDCMNWLAGGTRGAKVVSPELLDDIGTRIGVASRIELSGNNTPGIAAVALPSQAYDIVLNGEGAFFYGGDIPGLSAHLSSSSNAGNIFVLLHELSHVVGGLINDDDNDSTVNAANNSVIWQHCQKTVTGGN